MITKKKKYTKPVIQAKKVVVKLAEDAMLLDEFPMLALFGRR